MVNSVVNSWKEEHFVAYLYLVVADSDAETTPEELAMALRKSKKIIAEYVSGAVSGYEATFEAVKDELTHHEDGERKATIDMLAKKIKLDSDLKTDVVSDLNDIISSDDTVQDSEHSTVNYIRLVFTKN
ncbi:MAG: hypothetical protein EAZ53_01540 [Bacteroidetes bacterium]|nr:MAG: hypothetical protein EAZ53_01540 [Bacteroidota bacterium]